MQTQASDDETFDALIIGAGQAAKPLAIALGEAGWKTAVIERKQVGGSCINFGCTPTKAMAASRGRRGNGCRGLHQGERAAGNAGAVHLCPGRRQGRPAFTHIAYDGNRVLKANLLQHGNGTVSGRPVPYAVFIDPQVGRVGLTECQAKEAGHRTPPWPSP